LIGETRKNGWHQSALDTLVDASHAMAPFKVELWGLLDPALRLNHRTARRE